MKDKDKARENFAVIRQYSDQKVVEGYSCVGLFPSEEILVNRFFPIGSSVLDIGCGAGRTSVALAQKGYIVSGIDITPAMIAKANLQAESHRVQVNFQLMNAVEMTFEPESFDNVLFSFNGFEQIPRRANRQKVVRDIFLILRRGGHFILTTRSGLGFGRRLVAWPVLLMIYLWRHANGIGCELGDKYWRGEYYHYICPFALRRRLKAEGFTPLYFNSETGLIAGKNETFWTDLSADRMLYYVLRKPLVQCDRVGGPEA